LAASQIYVHEGRTMTSENARYWLPASSSIAVLGVAEKIRKLGLPVRTLVSFEGH
jgi:hypothetical protein